MKSKKNILLFVCLFIVILGIGWYTISYLNKKEETSIEEYIPQEEITEEQARSTIVTVYFPNKETGKLMPEAKIVDVKEIVNNPYEKVIKLLIEGPTNEKLIKIVPDNTQLLGTALNNDTITINLSSDILVLKEDKNITQENLEKSIVNTLTELTEIDKVKILIDGHENEKFKKEYTRFKN